MGERFIPKKIAEYGHADLQEAKQLLDKVSLVDGANRVADFLDILNQIPQKADDLGLDEEARKILKNKILAYSYWWMNCVVGNGVLRGNISLWQRTPNPEKLSFEATFGRR